MIFNQKSGSGNMNPPCTQVIRCVPPEKDATLASAGIIIAEAIFWTPAGNVMLHLVLDSFPSLAWEKIHAYPHPNRIMFAARPPKQGDDTLKVLRDADRDDVEAVIPALSELNSSTGREVNDSPVIEDVFDELDPAPGLIKSARAKSAFIHATGGTLDENRMPDGREENRIEAPHQAHVRNPWAIWRISDLFAQCGPLLTVFIGSQIASAAYVAAWLARILGQEKAFMIGVLLLAVFVADGVTFALFRGRLLAGFKIPATVLVLTTIVPGAILRAFEWWNAMHPQEVVLP